MIYSVTKLTELFPHEEELLSLPAGSVLYRQGDWGRHMFVVKYGDVDFRVDGHLVEIGRVGNSVGEESLLDKSPRIATVEATTDCKMIVIDRARLESLMRCTPGLSCYLKNLLALRRISWNAEIGHDFA